LIKYDTIDKILDKFCNVRYEYYTKRKNHQILALEAELTILRNKQRFVSEVIEEKLLIMNVKESEIIQQLKKSKYAEDPKKEEGNGGYEYLLRLQVRTFTEDKVKQIKDEVLSLEKKLNEVRTTTEAQVWLQELEEFEVAYASWVVEMDKQIGKSKKRTKK
jgi:DNA topoisomerase-2